MKKLILFGYTILFLAVSSEIIAQDDSAANKSNYELFPIVNYDTDTGFGYGGKAYVYDLISKNESFDITIYNSTKGERWYKLFISFPDVERRQGKKYSLAVDLDIDYDKWINYKYYGKPLFSIQSYVLDQSETYTREPIEITLNFSRAFTRNFVVSAGLRYQHIVCYNFSSTGSLKYNINYNNGSIQAFSIPLNIRYDTRDSFIDPKAGLVASTEVEPIREFSPKRNLAYKYGLNFQSYIPMYNNSLVLASRLIYQQITSSNISPLLFLTVGGNSSIRGIPQDRYISDEVILINNELRFPVYWRFGAIAGIDIGRAKPTPEQTGSNGWIINYVIGLRFHMDNFIVRCDFGIGKETTGLYFNFGHIF
jgi:outer membrane protein assembly factor BamA